MFILVVLVLLLSDVWVINGIIEWLWYIMILVLMMEFNKDNKTIKMINGDNIIIGVIIIEFNIMVLLV